MKCAACLLSLLGVVAAVELEHAAQGAVTNEELEDAVSMVQGMFNDGVDAAEVQEKVRPETMTMMMDMMKPMLEPFLEQKGLTWEELRTPQGLMKAMLPTGDDAPPGMDKFRDGFGALLKTMSAAKSQSAASAAPRDPKAPLDVARLQRSMETAKGLLRPLLEPALAKQNTEWGDFDKFVNEEVDTLKTAKTMPDMLTTMKDRMMKDLEEGREKAAPEGAAPGASPFGAEAGGLGDMAKMFTETLSKLREGPEAAQEATNSMKSKVMDMVDKMPGAEKSKGLLQKMMSGQELSESDVDTLPGMDNPMMKEVMHSARANAKKWTDKMKGALGDYEEEEGPSAAAVRLETGAKRAGGKKRKSKAEAMTALQGMMKEQAQELGGMIRQMLKKD